MEFPNRGREHFWNTLRVPYNRENSEVNKSCILNLFWSIFGIQYSTKIVEYKKRKNYRIKTNLCVLSHYNTEAHWGHLVLTDLWWVRTQYRVRFRNQIVPLRYRIQCRYRIRF